MRLSNRSLRCLACILLLLILGVFNAAAQSQDWMLVETIGRGKIDDVVWLSDGRLAAFGARGIWIYEDLRPGTEPILVEASQGWIHDASISGDVLVTGHENGAVTIWDANNLTEIAHVVHDDGSMRTTDISADGTRLVFASSETGVQVLDIPSQRIILDWRLDELVNDVVISPDGHWMYILVTPTFAQTNNLGNPTELEIVDIDKPQNSQRAQELGSDFVTHLDISADGNWLALPGSQGLHIWDTQAGELVRANVRSSEFSIPIFANGDLFLIHPKALTMVDTETWTESANMAFEEMFYASNAAVSDGWVAMVGFEGHFDETLRILSRDEGTYFDVAYEQAVQSVIIEHDDVIPDSRVDSGQTATSADGRWRARWSFGEGLYLEDRESETGKLLLSSSEDRRSANHIILDPNSKWIAAASPPQSLYIWDVATGAPLIENFETSRIYDLAWSQSHFAMSTPDGVGLWSNGAWADMSWISFPRTVTTTSPLRLLLGTEQIIVWGNTGEDTSMGECIGCGDFTTGFVLYLADLNADVLNKVVETDEFTARAVALSPDETFVAAGGLNGVSIIDLETGEETYAFDSGLGAQTVVLFDEMGQLVVGYESGLVQIWEGP